MNALIMAGGSGTRFWPLSRVARPKQFLSLWGDETLLGQTVDRLKSFVGLTNIYIVTGREYGEMTVSHAPGVPEGNIILEPFGRNTAACIGLVSVALLKQGKGGEVTIVCPADHLIGDEERFREVVIDAEKVAARGRLVVIGITPFEPSPHYGYIESGEALAEFNGFYAVRRFVEKPSRERAQQMLEMGSYYWNAGIFLWTPNAILEAIRIEMPPLHEGLMKIMEAWGTPDQGKTIENVYHALLSVPIDIGILERSDKLAMIPAQMDWCDVGNWSSLRKVLKPDADENVRRGKTAVFGSKRCLLWSSGRLVAAVGMDGVAIVETEDSILVCSLERDQDLKDLMILLDKEGYGHCR